MSKKKKKNEERKTKFKTILIYLLLILSIILIYAHYVEPYNLIIKEYKIENKIIPKSFDGIKIVHFSDIHFGSTVDINYIKKIVKLINKQNPDIVVFTGDFVDEKYKPSKKEIESIKNELSKINSTLGNYYINGNHDYDYKKIYKNIMSDSFTLLNNKEVLLYYKDNTPISIVGLDDLLKSKVDYKVLETNTEYFKIVLCHEPDIYNKINKYNFNVLLSGHSHNGQVRIPFIGPIYTPKGAKTYYDDYYKINNKEIFVSNGIGTSGLNLRFNSKPSINLYRLYAQ